MDIYPTLTSTCSLICVIFASLLFVTVGLAFAIEPLNEADTVGNNAEAILAHQQLVHELELAHIETIKKIQEKNRELLKQLRQRRETAKNRAEILVDRFGYWFVKIGDRSGEMIPIEEPPEHFTNQRLQKYF